MLYAILDWLQQQYQPPGFGAFAFITTRTAFAAATALIISLLMAEELSSGWNECSLRK